MAAAASAAETGGTAAEQPPISTPITPLQRKLMLKASQGKLQALLAAAPGGLLAATAALEHQARHALLSVVGVPKGAAAYVTTAAGMALLNHRRV